MKLAALLASLLLTALAAEAAEPIKVDVYLDGKLQQHVTLTGAHAAFKFTVLDAPGTSLEMKLVAPEPIIIDLKETASEAQPSASGRVKLVGQGGSANVSDLKDAKFRHAYVFVRPE